MSFVLHKYADWTVLVMLKCILECVKIIGHVTEFKTVHPHLSEKLLLKIQSVTLCIALLGSRLPFLLSLERQVKWHWERKRRKEQGQPRQQLLPIRLLPLHLPRHRQKVVNRRSRQLYLLYLVCASDSLSIRISLCCAVCDKLSDYYHCYYYY